MSKVSDKIHEAIPQKRHCPICGCKSSKLLFTQQFSEMSSGSLMKSYDVVVCADCRFAYADNIPDQAAFDVYYRSMSKYEHQHRDGVESPYDLARFRSNANTIKDLIPSPTSRILDIGCSTGRLLSLVREFGFPNVMGLDPSPACAEAARRLYGIQVLTGALAGLSVDERFDFLILVGVVEHIMDLTATIAKLKDILTPEGRVFIEAPDATRFAGTPDAPFQQFSTEHINFFSAASLANLMRANGFVEVLSSHTTHEQSHGTFMPVVAGVYQRDDKTSVPLEPDANTEECLNEYIHQSRSVENRLQQVIDDIADSGKPIIVWGVGTHTLRLLETSRLSEAKICCFVDSNPRYQGKQIHGTPIVSPSELKQRSEPILISSRVFQREIEHQIREDLGRSNELITLYEI